MLFTNLVDDRKLVLTSFSNQALQQEIQQGSSRGRASSKKSAVPPRSTKFRGAALSPSRPRGPQSGPPPVQNHDQIVSKFASHGPYPGGPPMGVPPFRGLPPPPRHYRPHPFNQMQYPYYNNSGYNNGPPHYGYGPQRQNGYGHPRANGYSMPNGYDMPHSNGYSPSCWSSCRLEVVPPPIPLQTYLEVGLIVV